LELHPGKLPNCEAGDAHPWDFSPTCSSFCFRNGTKEKMTVLVDGIIRCWFLGLFMKILRHGAVAERFLPVIVMGNSV